MSKGDDARRGLFGNMTSGGESARSGLRVRDCRHSTTGRPAQPPSRRFPPRISFLLFLFSRARSVFPTLASLPLLSPLPSSPLSPPPPPARVESSRYYRFSLDLPPPPPPASDHQESPANFSIFSRDTFYSLLFSSVEEEESELNDSVELPFPPASLPPSFESKI